MSLPISLNANVLRGVRTKIADIALSGNMPITGIIASSQGNTLYEIYCDDPVNDLSFGINIPTITASAVGGSLPMGKSLYFAVTAVDDNGESAPTAMTPAIKTANSNNGSMDISWTAVTGATKYRIYCGEKPQMETFVAEVETTTYKLINLPVFTNNFPAIPSRPSIAFYGSAARTEPIVISAMPVSNIKVFVTPLGTYDGTTKVWIGGSILLG